MKSPKDLIGEVQALLKDGDWEIDVDYVTGFHKSHFRIGAVHKFTPEPLKWIMGRTLRTALRKFVKAAKRGGK